ncbi:MAG: hypothetical protein BGO90_02240 [Legionella sp. 40-6]|nr:hypothetical protein [Legionella sp.]OJY16524.1 MAG: hypothetical protein BGO90_02240 [Legionella sp. 40-6]
MNEQYTAAVYCGHEQIAKQEGKDVDALYTWMLTQVNGHFGDIHGTIVENSTQKTVRTFRKSAIE